MDSDVLLQTVVCVENVHDDVDCFSVSRRTNMVSLERALCLVFTQVFNIHTFNLYN